MKRKGLFFVVAVVAFVAGAISYRSGLAYGREGSPFSGGGPAPEEIHRRLATLPDSAEPFKLVAKLIEPSVVHINAMRLIRRSMPPLPIDPLLREFFEEDLLERYFRRRMPQGYVLRGLGSGFVVNAERGIILTNTHVISGADEVTVSLADSREFRAQVLGMDETTDVAVLQARADGLHAAMLGDSDDLEVGEWVLAFGNPFGLDRTVTLGIVSAKGRRGMGITPYEDFIQTDCAINPGNSGGPLVNIRGRVVGMNTAIVSRSGGYQGIGFAIPTNVAKAVMEQITQRGRVVRGWLGITASDLSPEWLEKLGISGGAYVLALVPKGPADKANIAKGDVITAIDDVPLKDTGALYNRVALLKPGTRVVLGVFRDGATKSVALVIGEEPEGWR